MNGGEVEMEKSLWMISKKIIYLTERKRERKERYFERERENISMAALRT